MNINEFNARLAEVPEEHRAIVRAAIDVALDYADEAIHIKQHDADSKEARGTKSYKDIAAKLEYASYQNYDHIREDLADASNAMHNARGKSFAYSKARAVLNETRYLTRQAIGGSAK